MRKQLKTMLSLLLAIVTICLVSPVSYAIDTNDATEKKSELNIQITPPSTESSSTPGGSDSTEGSTESGGGGAGGSSSNSNGKKDTTKDKLPSTYTPAKATVVQNLPQTGEIVTSFVVVILGLSLLMFTLGVLINKRVSENHIEMELYL